MGQVNRYTRIQPERYNARSLQETMMAPQYMRQQHDAIDSKIADTETALAQIDPLDVHSDVARMEQQKLYDQLTSQAEKLTAEGFNPSSKSDFMRLNKKYQQAISPTGKLGRIQTAKKTLGENKARYLENAINDGYSPEQAQINWGNHVQKYNDKFIESGKVSNIEDLGAPNYFDYIEEGKSLFREAGITGTDVTTGGGRIVQDELGNYVVNGEHRDFSENNKLQLQSAVDFLNNRILNKNSDANKSIIHQGKTAEGVINELAGLSDVYIKDKTGSVDKNSLGSYTPRTKDDENRGYNFYKDTIQGYSIKTLNPSSPINTINTIENPTFDENGELISGEGEFKTYQEKIDNARDNLSVSIAAGNVIPQTIEINPETGLYEITSHSRPHRISGSISKTVTPIQKSAFHLKSDFDEMRKNNYLLGNLSDKELYNRLKSYNTSIEENYINSIDLPNANWEGLNDRMFGSRRGSGEYTTGLIDQKDVTINGVDYTSDLMVEQLDFDNETDFKENGNPTIRGFMPSSGKYLIKATNKKGVPINIFIEGSEKLLNITKFTRLMSKEMFSGTSFKELGVSPSGEYLYFVNDFIEPRLVKSKTKANNISELSNADINNAMPMSHINAIETNNLINDTLFREEAGIKKNK